MVLDFGDGYRLRPALAPDHAAMSMVCLKTGDSGKDATDREDDPSLLGLIYAVPYQIYEPDFAFVVDGPEGVCGYILGAKDSDSFYRRLTSEWFPPIAARISDPGPDEADWQGSDWARYLIHHPDFGWPLPLRSWPAHGHIDLLEEARGRNIGRRGMEHMMTVLKAAGAPGIHLGVSPKNRGAQAFYKKLGFAVVSDPTLPRHTLFMARPL
jgi:ribosomal protein S18 acetylase RimI-like enzyme